MKNIGLILCIFILLSATGAPASELPVLWLEEGTNRIGISIVNEWRNDLYDLKAKVNNEELPEWLSIKSISQPIDVRSGSKGIEKLYLVFDVTNSPIGTEAEIPFMLQDSQGNEWNYTAIVQINNASKPLEYALYENFPNPFNPTTTISYSLKDAHNIRLTILNSLGQKIRTLLDDHQTAGIHTVQWDGRNAYGEQVSSGVYFYRLEAGTFVKTKRMMLIE